MFQALALCQSDFPHNYMTMHLQCINPLSPNSDLSQISHCSIKGLLVREVTRIENMITS